MSNKEKNRKTEKALQQPHPSMERNPWHEVERWFDEFSRRGSMSPFSFEWPHRLESAALFSGRSPRVDIIDREKEILVRAEMPGVLKDDLDVTVTDHSVMIKAETRTEKKDTQDAYYRRELSRGEYQRTLELPHVVDENRATAVFTDGILELTLPKMEKTPHKKVRVE